MLDAQVLAFIGVAAVLTVTPGADTMLVIRNVLAYGRKAGLLTVLGICSGLLVHATLSSAGLSLILMRSAEIFEIVKLIGAGYLIFIGVQSIRGLFQVHDAAEHEDVAIQQKSAKASFAQGMLSNVLNPKVAIFYLAFLPQFINPGDPVLLKSILLALIHLVMGIIWLSIVAFFVGAMRTLLTRPEIRARIEAVSGVILIGLGVRLAFERR